MCRDAGLQGAEVSVPEMPMLWGVGSAEGLLKAAGPPKAAAPASGPGGLAGAAASGSGEVQLVSVMAIAVASESRAVDAGVMFPLRW